MPCVDFDIGFYKVASSCSRHNLQRLHVSNQQQHDVEHEGVLHAYLALSCPLQDLADDLLVLSRSDGRLMAQDILRMSPDADMPQCLQAVPQWQLTALRQIMTSALHSV